MASFEEAARSLNDIYLAFVRCDHSDIENDGQIIWFRTEPDRKKRERSALGTRHMRSVRRSNQFFRISGNLQNTLAVLFRANDSNFAAHQWKLPTLALKKRATLSIFP